MTREEELQNLRQKVLEGRSRVQKAKHLLSNINSRLHLPDTSITHQYPGPAPKGRS